MRRWFKVACSQRPLNHYQLLRLKLFESRPEVIEAAATRITQFLQNLNEDPDRGQARQLLQAVAAAQLCLLGPAKKAAYDAQLRAELDRRGGPQAPADNPAEPPGIVPVIKVRPTPVPAARKRTAQQRPDRVALPGSTGLDQSPLSSETGTSGAETNAAAIPVFPGGTKRPAAPRSLTASRRKPSAWTGWIMLGVCGVSAGAVVALFVYLLGRPPVVSRPIARQVPPAATTPVTPPPTTLEAPPAPKPQDAHEPKAATAARTAPKPRQPATEEEEGGVRAYSKQETEQRRQGIDSFAAMANSEAARLHRDEPPGQPQAAGMTQVPGMTPGAGMTPGPEIPQPPGQPQGSQPAEVPVAITDGLLAHWAFEEKSREQAIDSSPNARPGYLEGRPASIADGAPGSALRFDGQDDCLRVPDGMVKGTAGTIALWVRRANIPESTSLVDSAAEPARFCLLLKDGKLTGGYGPVGNSKPIGGGAPVGPGQWHHVALTWKSGGEVVLYLDGQWVGRQSAGQLPDPTGVVIGKNPVTVKCFAIDVDEIRLFNRSLSPTDVTELVEMTREPG